MMLEDMKAKLDISQYGNTKGVSIQHYLIKFIDQVLQNLDNNSKGDIFAAVATFVDWKQAFNRQDPKLGVESFIENGVRPALIPTLINYFQNREMYVKWHGQHSSRRKLKGGGPQGGTLGIIEFVSQSNTNANCVEADYRWKWVDDLTMLEIKNLLSIGLASYNNKFQVPNDFDVEKNYIPSESLKTNTYLKEINEWTDNQKMKLNKKKTNSMIFNYTKNFQFNTRFKINEEKIDIVKKTKLLGTIITDDMTWEENTKELIKKANMRMWLLRKVSSFKPSREDLKLIYIQYVRSTLEQSCVVWQGSLTVEQRENIERLQKNSLRIILRSDYKNYENALDVLNLQTLECRRKELSLKFALKCKYNSHAKNLFKVKNKEHLMNLRKTNTYKTTMSERYYNSAVPYMERLLNEHTRKN